MLPHYDVIILGAGASGLMCAMTAGQRGRRVLVVDHAPKMAEKVRISGGGRCNFTNLYAQLKAAKGEHPRQEPVTVLTGIVPRNLARQFLGGFNLQWAWASGHAARTGVYSIVKLFLKTYAKLVNRSFALG